MKLTQLLLLINQLANQNELSQPYIVGGLVRDKLMQRVDNIDDIDITTGDESIHALSEIVYANLKTIGANIKKMPDGHSKIFLGDFRIDFSSNFTLPQIERVLKKGGIKTPTNMQKEMYSRDFTCNTALMTLDLSKIIDATGLAVEDIKNKQIQTCLPPSITLGYDNNRIIRAIYLAAKLNFEIAPRVKEWIKFHPKSINNIKEKYLNKKISAALSYNREKTMSLLDELGISVVLPPLSSLGPYQ